MLELRAGGDRRAPRPPAREACTASRTAVTVADRRAAHADRPSRGRRPPRRRPPRRRTAALRLAPGRRGACGRPGCGRDVGRSRGWVPHAARHRRHRGPVLRVVAPRAGAAERARSSTQQPDQQPSATAPPHRDERGIQSSAPAPASRHRRDDRADAAEGEHHDAPHGGRRSSSKPAPAATRTSSTIAMPTSSAILSAVPNSAIAASFAHGGARSMRAPPIAANGLAAG